MAFPTLHAVPSPLASIPGGHHRHRFEHLSRHDKSDTMGGPAASGCRMTPTKVEDVEQWQGRRAPLAESLADMEPRCYFVTIHLYPSSHATVDTDDLDHPRRDARPSEHFFPHKRAAYEVVGLLQIDDAYVLQGIARFS